MAVAVTESIGKPFAIRISIPDSRCVMRPARLLAAALVFAVVCRPCRAQFVRPPVIVPRAPVHIPVHVPGVPHSPNQGGNGPWDDVAAWLLWGGVALLVGLGVCGFVARARR